MDKNDNPHALRLLDSMTKHGEQAAGEKFSEAYPLAESADFHKTFEWVKNVCTFLEERFDDAAVKAIRMDCACGPEYGMCAELKALYEEDTDPDVFVQKINRLSLGFTLEYDGKYYDLIYPQCYCSCVEKSDELLSKTWCYCTLGYSKRMFACIFDKEVQAELISSVKTGDANCRIRIIL